MSLDPSDQPPRQAPPAGPIQRQIDENLKRIFDETAGAPLPDKLTDLLAQLRAKESGE